MLESIGQNLENMIHSLLVDIELDRNFYAG
jgi:hypothetical protein